MTTVAADRKQLPIAVLLTLVSATDEPVKCVRSVVAGNVIVIWLPAVLDRPPVEEVVNAIVYATFPAPAAVLLSCSAGWLIGCAATIEKVFEPAVSDVVSTLIVLVPVLGALTTPSITTLTVWLGPIDWPLNSVQVTTVAADRKQLPIAVLLTLVSATEEPTRPVRSVFAGNVIRIWLPAALDSPPVDDVVNPTV